MTKRATYSGLNEWILQYHGCFRNLTSSMRYQQALACSRRSCHRRFHGPSRGGRSRRLQTMNCSEISQAACDINTKHPVPSDPPVRCGDPLEGEAPRGFDRHRTSVVGRSGPTHRGSCEVETEHDARGTWYLSATSTCKDVHTEPLGRAHGVVSGVASLPASVEIVEAAFENCFFTSHGCPTRQGEGVAASSETTEVKEMTKRRPFQYSTTCGEAEAMY